MTSPVRPKGPIRSLFCSRSVSSARVCTRTIGRPIMAAAPHEQELSIHEEHA